LGVFGTGLTFLLNLSIIRDVGATVASTVAYVMPIFSTLLGVVALGEPLAWYEPLGAAIIIAGAVLAQPRNSAAPTSRALSFPRSMRRSPARSRTSGW
ncbi:MAG: EamA family transporter, partial [Solirubrobacteraceae bacterium]